MSQVIESKETGDAWPKLGTERCKSRASCRVEGESKGLKQSPRLSARPISGEQRGQR